MAWQDAIDIESLGLDVDYELIIRTLQRNSVAIIAALSALVFLWSVFKPSAAHRSKIAVAAGSASKSTPTVLFVGPMGSGKTSFFGRLVYHSAPPTHTSMVPSSALLPDNLKVVDLPGHPRLRSHLLATHLPAASGVVFFVDPSTNATSQSIPTTAEHLHTVLALLRTLDEKLGSRRKRQSIPPLLILLSKSDTWTAAQKTRSLERVKQGLERELEKRRQASLGATSSGQSRLESIDELPSGTSSGSSSLNPFKVFGRLFSGKSPDEGLGKPLSSGLTLPQDEQEILQSDVLDFDGPFSWNEDKLGINVTWGVSNSKPIENKDDDITLEKEQEGVKAFWNWVDTQV